MQAVFATGRHQGLLEDYLFLLNADSARAMAALTEDQFSLALHNTIAPQVQIAINLGFHDGWTY